MQTALILLAAGKAQRMRGSDKLLEDVAGRPCVKTLALRGLSAGLMVVVALPDRDHPRAQALAEVPVLRLPVPDADQGMAQSLKTAISALPDGTEAAIVLPADMPDILAEDLTALCDAAQAHPDKLILQAATEDGAAGHPVLFRSALFSEFATLSGETGAREIIDRHRLARELVPRPGSRARIDLDTPEEWATWRAAQAADRA